jgi:hypothetical protein
MPTKSLHDKSTCHVMCVKKIKFDAKNKAFHISIFVFLHRPQNISIFGETLQTRLDCEYVNEKKLVNFFLHSKLYFLDRGSVCIQELN